MTFVAGGISPFSAKVTSFAKKWRYNVAFTIDSLPKQFANLNFLDQVAKFHLSFDKVSFFWHIWNISVPEEKKKQIPYSRLFFLAGIEKIHIAALKPRLNLHEKLNLEAGFQVWRCELSKSLVCRNALSQVDGCIFFNY